MPSPDKHPAIAEVEREIEKYLRNADECDEAKLYAAARQYREHATGMEKALRIVKRHLEG